MMNRMLMANLTIAVGLSASATVIHDFVPGSYDSDKAQLKRFLLEARESDEPVEIHLPAATYAIGDTVLPIFSNTTLVLAEGAVLDFTGRTGGGLIRGYHMTGGVECRGGSSCTHSGFSCVENVHIRGGIVKVDPAYTGTVFDFSHATDVTVEDVEILDGVRGLSFDACRAVAVSGCSCADIRFVEDVTGSIRHNTIAGSQGHGIWVKGSSACSVLSNSVSSVAKCAISVESSGHGTLCGNVVTGGTHGVYLSESTQFGIHGNIVASGGTKYRAIYLGDGTTNCVLEDNRLGLGGFDMSPVRTSGNVVPVQTEFDVVADGYASGDGLTDDTAAFKTCLRKAMNAGSKITVTVPAGRFRVDSQLVVFPNTHLKLASDAVVDTRNRSGGTILAFHHFDDKGVECYGGSDCAHANYAGATNITVEGGLWLRSDLNSAAFADCRNASGVTMRSVKTSGTCGRGLEFTSCREICVSDCAVPELRLNDVVGLVEKCQLKGSHNYGLQARNGSVLTITGNHIANAQKDGIFLYECGPCTARGNQVRDVGGYGVQIKGSSANKAKATIADNDIDCGKTDRYDIFLGDYCVGCTVVGNRLGTGGYWTSQIGVSGNTFKGYDPGTTEIVQQVVVTNYGADVSSINRALRLANCYTQGGIEAVFPSGEYVIDGALSVFPNTVITLKPGARIVSSAPGASMLKARHLNVDGSICEGDASCKHGGYGQSHDIVIQGGVWDRGGFTSEETVVFSLYHSKNIIIRNAELTRASGHFVNISGSAHVLVDNVIFSKAVAGASSESPEWLEALHADYIYSAGEPTGYPIDNTAPGHIVVRNCVFDGVYSGFGTHHCPMGAEAEDIRIEGCLFKDVKHHCIDAYAFSSMTVRGCRYASCPDFLKAWSCSPSLSDNVSATLATVEFGADGGVVDRPARLYAVGTPFGVLSAVEREDWNFGGWKTPAGDVVTTNTVLTSAIRSLTPIWTAQTARYCVTLYQDSERKSSWSDTIPVNTVFALPKIDSLGWSKPGCRFSGWVRSDSKRRYDDGVLCFDLGAANSNISFVAQWEKAY